MMQLEADVRSKLFEENQRNPRSLDQNNDDFIVSLHFFEFLLKTTFSTLCARRIDTFLKILFLCHKHAKTIYYVVLTCL